MAEITAKPRKLLPNFLSLPVLRPVATSMLFLAIVILGAVGIARMPIQLFPAIPTEQLSVSFSRPGSTSDVVEREVLIPLTSRIRGLQGVRETIGQILGDRGYMTITFDPGTDLKVREYEIRRIAGRMQRNSELRTTNISVSGGDSSRPRFDAFVMTVFVLGGDRETDQVYDLAVEMVVPRLSSIPGVARAVAMGGGGQQVIVAVDTDKTASLGATIEQVIGALNSKLGSAAYVGNFESEDGRTNVVFDGTADSLNTLRQARISPNNPLTVGHVADIYLGYGQNAEVFQVDGNPAVGIALEQEQGSNLIDIGREVRKRLGEIRAIVQSVGIDLKIGLDASESMDEQIQRLINLGLTGFGVALLVLFLFLRQWRAVAIVGIAVPVSLMTAIAGLYLLGHSINLLTLFGLAMSVGLLVDNSVVVYEAILRGIERGITPTEAARLGLRKTVRAIIGASVTTAVVFLPIFLIPIESALFREMLQILSVSVVLPLFSSLFVAVGLVPLLAHRLAAPAAVRRMQEQQRRRAQRGGLLVPDRARVLLAGLVTNALRQPASWLAGTLIAVVATVFIAGPWASRNNSSGDDAPQADSINFTASVAHGRSTDLDTMASYVSTIGRDIKSMEGVDTVESAVDQNQARFTVHFVEEDERPPDFSAVRIREAAQQSAERKTGLSVGDIGDMDYSRASEGRGYGSLSEGTSQHEVILSGPDPKRLFALSQDLQARLSEVNYVDRSWLPIQSRNRELWVEPDETALQSFGLMVSEALPFLQIAGQRGQTLASPYPLPSGREVSVVVEREGVREDSVARRRDFNDMRIQTSQGVLPIAAFSRVTEMPAPGVIVHKNGRREMKVRYSLDRSVPDSGSGREAIENEVKDFIRSVPRPEGYVIDIPDADQASADTGQQLGLAALGLVFLSLAIILESLILPVLVMVAIPLTLLGTLWGLALTGTPLLNQMAIAGMLVLIGLMVNPAILLIDRMQQFSRIGYSSGAAAYAAVKERTRPVLLTAATTIAALWPLSLATGAENEMWPPFAIVVMSGLATSAIMTLILVPVGYVLLRRLDLLFGRVGPWLVIGWGVALVGIMTLLVMVAGLTGLLWQVVVALLVGGFLLALIVFFFRRVHIPEPDSSDDGPPELEITYLSKIYGLPGPIRRTLNAHKDFARKVVEAGGKVFNRKDMFERSMVFMILALGAGALGWLTPERGWGLIFWLIASGFVARVFLEIRKARGLVSDDGRAQRGGIEGFAVVLLPWLAIGGFVYFTFVRPILNEDGTQTSLFWPIVAALVLLIGQVMRRSATRQERGALTDRVVRGFMKYPRTWWRRLSRRVGGLDLPAEEIEALWSVSFPAKRGMIGILGPNGAGKTTLLRQLAGIINPTRGAIKVGGVPLPAIQKVLARWVGYLPQDAGLPLSLTPRDYLQYYAALYDIDPEIRKERVASLIEEVGLADKIDDKISSLSGGMKQRVAVARTLLRLPAIIIVDEPTVGLDPRERIRFRNLLARLAESRIVLFSTHVVEDVAISCERVLVIAKSRLRFDGTPSDLATNAVGRVWEKKIAQGQDKSLPEGAILAEEAPDASGDTIQRIIWSESPSEDAKQLDPRPEDGYLWLLATS